VQAVAARLGATLLMDPVASAPLLRAACGAAGVVYPAYASLCAVDSRRIVSLDDERDVWLTYWAVYGLYRLIEDAGDEVLRTMPYYHHLKLALIAWLVMPQTRGASMLYTRYLRPALRRFRPKIDVCTEKLCEGGAAVYTMYKVPIDALVAAARAGVRHTRNFLAWLLDGAPGGSGDAGDAANLGSRNLVK